MTGCDDAAARDALRRIDAEVATEHGWNPLGESVWRDLDAPSDDSCIVIVREDDEPIAAVHACRARRGWVVALAARDDVIPPVPTACAAIAARGGGPVTAWITDSGSPGALAARAALRAVTLEPTRRLRRLEAPLPMAVAAPPPGVSIDPFVPSDAPAWLEVNNRAFTGHDEQGGWDAPTFERRRAEPWFRSDDLRCAHEHGVLIGSCWTKTVTEPGRPTIGEVYVIAVDPDHQRRGLGVALVTEGLAHQAQHHGAQLGMLYTDATNLAALALYGALGFEVVRTDEAWTGTIA